MRTGAEYKEALRDGRDVWVLGEGPVADVTTHPATSAMVDEYVAWYDRHFDPDWQDVLLTPPDPNGQRHPLALTPPKTSDDLRRMGKQISAVHFLTGGNMTHTPGYGELIALGLQNVMKRLDNSAEDIDKAEEYLEHISTSGRFLTYAGGGPLIGTRLRPDESERAALRWSAKPPTASW
ncbi:4-nitrophenol 4-monooxygenase/4-nitrocatechol 2-monooxygenase, oxygenase component [Geodia barretti]|uniref:4-nitrophenol 4-monooxygenase/4-nitrocatechol 2-monooxygenase, oxygenase component n=1 Tax=Geodia barretti TaxID=519541 RepID=A0AA35VZ00_GEOBA|nr:4-nitrophenol 4-monooxygenase/4-nitrocatechol 2-monooxygenase, oxygenase component [Geodia barretti]